MANFKLYPVTSLLNSVYVPDFFKPKVISTTDGSLTLGDNFTIERDVNGLDSIIRLHRIPFIDLSKYDKQRRKWFSVDKYGGLWRLYDTGEWIVERGEYNNVTAYETIPGSRELFTIKTQAAVSMEGLLGGDVYDIHSSFFDTTTMWKYNALVDHKIEAYSPITLTVNKIELTDITNYSGNENVATKLDTVDPDNNKEFYYNFKDAIYTNQDLSLYNPEDIYLSYTVNISRVNVSCRMDTNITNLSPYTPVVDYFVIKLTGQNL